MQQRGNGSAGQQTKNSQESTDSPGGGVPSHRHGTEQQQQEDRQRAAARRVNLEVDIGKQHVGCIQTPCTIGVAGNNRLAVATDDLFTNWYSLSAVVRDLWFPEQKLLTRQDSLQRLLGRASALACALAWLASDQPNRRTVTCRPCFR